MDLNSKSPLKLFQIILLVNVTHQKSIDRNDPSSEEVITTNSTKVTSENEVSALKNNENILQNFLRSETSKDQKRYKPGYWLPEPEEAETFNYSVVPVQDFTYYYFY